MGNIESTDQSKKPNRKLLEKAEVLHEIVLRTFYTKTYRVCSIPNTDQFYVRGNNDILRCMNTKGALLAEIVTESTADLTVTREGYLVYIDWWDKSIKIRKSGKNEWLITSEDFYPWGICSTSTDDLLVTMKSFITENKNLDIVVSNIKIKKVVVVDKEGKFRFSYNGNLKKPFDPRGVTTDSMCHILIADSSNNVIHIIYQNGQFLQYIDNCNLQGPNDLSTDSNDMLFVAEFETNIVKHIKYLE
ncbi:uncharacterized protein LOC125676401 [Ostrea edulis]|uniref:uncharacterized protein LOC125676401 n=1 Tax=Ostrea edulis TaxID=37623 RepID=UPI0024AFBB74|nr:uncharacterized protein LOC125676401 [Ostrea edulis]